jgi:hypothetical protein
MSDTSPWDYALINLRRLTHERNIDTHSLTQSYRKAKQICTGKIEPFKHSDMRRMRRLKTGDTKLSLRDLVILSQALDIAPGDLSFMSPKDFDKKYIDPIRNKIGKVEKPKKVWQRPKNI